MRLIILGDTHFGSKLNGENRSPHLYRSFLNLLDEVRDEGVEAMVHLGDLFDSSTEQSVDVYFVRRCLAELFERDIALHVLSGNHDATSNRKNNALYYLGDDSEHLHMYIDQDQEAFFGQTPAWFIPYGVKEPLDIRFFDTGDILVFSHYDLIGARLPNGYVMDNGKYLPHTDVLNHSDKDRFKWFNGHYHDPQVVAVGEHQIHIPGSMDYLNYSADINKPRQFYIYDTDTGIITERVHTSECNFIELKPNVNEIGGISALPTWLDKAVDGLTGKCVIKVSVVVPSSDLHALKDIEAQFVANYSKDLEIVPFNPLVIREQGRFDMEIKSDDGLDDITLIEEFLKADLPKDLEPMRPRIKEYMMGFVGKEFL